MSFPVKIIPGHLFPFHDQDQECNLRWWQFDIPAYQVFRAFQGQTMLAQKVFKANEVKNILRRLFKSIFCAAFQFPDLSQPRERKIIYLFGNNQKESFFVKKIAQWWASDAIILILQIKNAHTIHAINFRRVLRIATNCARNDVNKFDKYFQLRFLKFSFSIQPIHLLFQVVLSHLNTLLCSLLWGRRFRALFSLHHLFYRCSQDQMLVLARWKGDATKLYLFAPLYGEKLDPLIKHHRFLRAIPKTMSTMEMKKIDTSFFSKGKQTFGAENCAKKHAPAPIEAIPLNRWPLSDWETTEQGFHFFCWWFLLISLIDLIERMSYLCNAFAH